MRIFVNLACFFLLNQTYSQPDYTNTAWIIIELHLMTIKNHVDGKNKDSTGRISSSVLFFESLTEINSESPGGFTGKFYPTINDYNRWETWFAINKKFLAWDKNLRVIIFRRKIRPPE